MIPRIRDNLHRLVFSLNQIANFLLLGLFSLSLSGCSFDAGNSEPTANEILSADTKLKMLLALADLPEMCTIDLDKHWAAASEKAVASKAI